MLQVDHGWGEKTRISECICKGNLEANWSQGRYLVGSLSQYIVSASVLKYAE